MFSIVNSRLSERDKYYSIVLDSSKQINIPKSQVIGKDTVTIKTKKFTRMVVTDWIFNKTDFLNLTSSMFLDGLIYIYGDNTFDILWDDVIQIGSDRIGLCFYCCVKCDRRTVDHIVPKSFLSAIGVSKFPFNTVHSCRDCNSIKRSFSLVQFKQIIKEKMLSKKIEINKGKEIIKTINRITNYKKKQNSFKRKT